MSGFLGIGGSSTKTDRGHELEGYGDLQNVFNYALPSSKQDQSAGNANINAGAGYERKLLSGDRTAAMSAVAPQIGTIQAQADQARKSQSNLGTSRGGGTNAITQQAADQEAAAEQGALEGAQNDAAKPLIAAGSTQLQAANQAMGIANSAGNDLTSNSETARQDSYKQNQAAGSAAANIAMGLLLA